MRHLTIVEPNYDGRFWYGTKAELKDFKARIIGSIGAVDKIEVMNLSCKVTLRVTRKDNGLFTVDHIDALGTSYATIRTKTVSLALEAL